MSRWRCWLRAVLPMLVGCASTGVGNPGLSEKEAALVNAGDDAMKEGDTATSLVSVSILALSDQASVTSADVAGSVVESQTPQYFGPAGCLSAARQGLTVSLTFQDCRTGAFGLTGIRGTVVATYATGAAGGVDVTVSTPEPLTIGTATVTLSAQASYAVTGTKRTLVWSGGYHAERRVRPSIDHQASYRVEYEASTQCLFLSGSATTALSTGFGLESNLADYLRCGARTACPKTGTLTLTALPDRDVSVVVDYEGAASLRVWVAKRGVDTAVPLSCEGS